MASVGTTVRQRELALAFLPGRIVECEGAGPHSDQKQQPARDRQIANEDVIVGATVESIVDSPIIVNQHRNNDGKAKENQRAGPRVITKRQR